jgi:hypothetical protein
VIGLAWLVLYLAVLIAAAVWDGRACRRRAKGKS